MYYWYAACYVPEIISHDLTRLLAVDPKNEYPEARMMRREFQIHVSGTNTGKTYQSLQRLKGAKTGVYLAPLRLLALEVQERMLEDGVVCSMLTGEEEDIREGATHISSTVEKLNVRQEFDVAVIDECQMINDTQRGYAWTRAILGVRAKEIHAMHKRYTTYELDGEAISREQAIAILGRETYLSGISRSAFHYTTARKTDDGRTVYFDSTKLFRG